MIRWLAALAVLILAIVPYLPGLPGEFVYDDHRLIADNEGLRRPFDPSRAFLRDYYASDVDRMGLGYYRPVAILSNELDWRRGGGEPLAFHVTNIAVHAACSLLVLALGLTLFECAIGAAFAAAALFAVHPAHAESVAFISGRVDPLATLFGLLALVLHLRGKPWLGALAWFPALLSKEMAVTVPAVALILDLARERRFDWKRYLPYAVVVAAYLPLRALALGGLLRPATGAEVDWTRPFVTAGSYLAWLLAPPYGMHVEPPPPVGVWAVAAIVALLAAVAWAGLRRGLPGMLLAATLATLAPVLQLRPIETDLSERFLYLPSALFVLALAAVGREARARKIAIAAGVLLGVVWLAVLVPRSIGWRDEAALWTRVEAETGGSLKARMNLARVLARRGDAETASRWAQAAAALKPEIGDGLRAEVAALSASADPEGAVKAIRLAIERTPGDGALWNNLGYMLLRSGQGSEAREAFLRATTLVPLRGSSWLGLALAESGVRNPEGALEAAERAATLDPTLDLARAIRADALLKLGRPCEALQAAAGVTLESAQERAVLETVKERAREACKTPLSN